MCVCLHDLQNWTDSSAAATVLILSAPEQAIWLKKRGRGRGPGALSLPVMKAANKSTHTGFSTWFSPKQLLWDSLDFSLYKLSSLIYTTAAERGTHTLLYEMEIFFRAKIQKWLIVKLFFIIIIPVMHQSHKSKRNWNRSFSPHKIWSKMGIKYLIFHYI